MHLTRSGILALSASFETVSRPTLQLFSNPSSPAGLSEVSSWLSIQAGVPQGSVLSPILYLLYESTTLAMFTDDTAILSTATTFAEANNKL